MTNQETKRQIIQQTETLDKLYLEWSQYTNARTARETRLETRYNELLMAVSRKHPGESRHETALRYICEAEATTDGPQYHAPDERRGG